MKRIKNYQITIVCFVLGALLGLVMQEEITILRLVGDVFVGLIKLAVIPLVFTAIVNSILNLHGKKDAKRMIGLVLGIFTLTTAISATIGIVNATIINPGGKELIGLGEKYTGTTIPTFSEFVLNLIPSNPFSALVDGNTFHVIVLAVIVGCAIIAVGKEKLSVSARILEEANEIIMKYIKAIVKIVPIGVFSLTATSFATFGQTMINSLMKYLFAIVLSIIIIYIMYLIIILIFSKQKINTCLKGLAKIWIVAASTSSSAATLPITMQTCDELQIDKQVSRFILPFGVTMNMNGAAQFMAVTFMFLAQVNGTSLNIVSLILAVCMITILVMATPGIPGGAMVPTTVVLIAFNIPVEMFAIVMGLYSLIDMLDTTVNVTGDVITAIVVDKSLKNRI